MKLSFSVLVPILIALYLNPIIAQSEVQAICPTEQIANYKWDGQAKTKLLERKLTVEAAKKTWHLYTINKLDENQYRKCLDKLKKPKNFKLAFSHHASSQMAKKLRSFISVPSLNSLIKISEALNKVPLERILAKTFFSLKQHAMRAGFHRAKGHIILSLFEIKPKDLLFVVIHELAHKSDGLLKAAIYSEVDTEGFEELAKTAKKISSPYDLPLQQYAFLQNQIQSSLNRAILGEYRAWAVTLGVYSEGLDKKTWPANQWLELLLIKINSMNGTYFDFFTKIFRYLDQVTVDPEVKNQFAIPLFRNELNNQLNRLRESNLPPPLGEFCSFLDCNDNFFR